MRLCDVPHPSSYILEEMEVRGWGYSDVAVRMGGKDKEAVGIDCLALEMYCTVHDTGLRIGDESADGLGRAFGVSPQLFLNLEKAWLSSEETK